MAVNPLIVIAAICFVSHISIIGAQNIEVAFQLNASTANPHCFVLDGDAFFVDGKVIQLTTTDCGLGFSDEGSVGRASYKDTIQLWNASTNVVANFSTHFQFQINWTNQSFSDSSSNLGGDGLAFFMAPLESGHYVKYRSEGGWLGLFDQNDDNPRLDQVVAVEFDTFANTWDPNNNHLGIDVNSIISVANVTLDRRLNDNKIWDAWINYNGQENILNVSVSSSSSGQIPRNLSYKINLTKILPENVVVGFSAAAYKSLEVHRVISWSFTSVISEPRENSITFEASSKNGMTFPLTSNRKISSKLVNAIASVGCVVSAISVFFVIYWYARKIKQSSEEEQSDIDMEFDRLPRKFPFWELSAATNRFSEKQKLGQGGFGDVYKGILVKSNEIVAVKRILAGSKQGKKEYVTEINTISSLRHRNCVQLLGWCHEKGQLLLIYEYMPNGSLDNLLFGKRRGGIDWTHRYKIASDIASALLYLHEMWDECVVHRDVKSSNVMLDSEFNAKLGDFGLARLMKHDQWTENSTIAGTLGYMAPECTITGISSAESDVFSFGAVALEIACGRRALDLSLEKSKVRLVEWVWDLYGESKLLDAVDSTLNGEFDRTEMMTLMMIGLWCSHPDPLTRPRIRQVLQVLNFEAPMPNLPHKLPKAAYSPITEECDTASTTDCPPVPDTSSQEISGVSSFAMSSDIPRNSTHASASANESISISKSSVI